MFSRKELIKKEYNRIIENKLPNILSLMNHDRQHLGEHSIHDNFDYDDTELLSKMFSKDQNRSGVINHNDLQVTL
ncbi:MAG: hypothetical protein ACMG6E_08575 [Candidatus Roizmanbacteria bacterium]